MDQHLNFSPDDLLVPDDQRTRECDKEDLKRLGMAADQRMVALASEGTHREQLTLAAMLIAEFASYASVAPGYLDRVLAPIIDCISAKLASSGHTGPPTDATIDEASKLAHHAERYHNLISALMNTAQNRMGLVEVPSGRLVFEPKRNGVLPELRDRWLYLRWHRSRAELGNDLATTLGTNASAVVAQLDQHVARYAGNRAIPSPKAVWWTDHVAEFAERALDGQFADVNPDEPWGDGLTGVQAKTALKPLFTFAVSTMLTNLRAFQMRAANGHRKAASLPHSCVPVLSRQELLGFFTRGGLTQDQAGEWMRAFVRVKGGERESLHSHPIIELASDQFALLPAALAHANLSLIVQQHHAGPALGAARCARHTSEVARLLQESGCPVDTDVDLVVNGETVTDLDILTVTPDGKLVVVLQLKSFVPRPNLLELQRAASYVSEASVQCQKADQHLEVVKALVEAKLGVVVAADWKLRQFIVVDLVAGSPEPEPYPTLSMEWLRSEGPAALAAGLEEFVERATHLPDGADWFDTVRPTYGLMDLTSLEPVVGHEFAICDYWAPPPETRVGGGE